MKNLVFPFTLLLFIGFSFSRCGFSAIADEAEVYADKFYNHLKDSDFDAIVKMLDKEALEISPESDWLAVLKQKEEYGKLEHLKKDIGFNTSIQNGRTLVTLHYTSEYTNITFYEKIILIKRGEDFKIYSYEYNSNKGALSDD